MQMKKFIGKPYAGKPHVRFDEGVGKVYLSFPLYSTDTSYAYEKMIFGSHDIVVPACDGQGAGGKLTFWQLK